MNTTIMLFSLLMHWNSVSQNNGLLPKAQNPYICVPGKEQWIYIVFNSTMYNSIHQAKYLKDSSWLMSSSRSSVCHPFHSQYTGLLLQKWL